MSDFRIVTISNREPQEWYYLYKQLFKSVGEHEILVLGQGENVYTGLSDKPRILYHAINEGKIKEKHIIFVDAWDVLFAHSPYVVMEKYYSFKTSIVVGAEKNCFPACFQKEYDKKNPTSSYKYLNSGVIIGETDSIMTVLESMDAPNLPVDYHNPNKGNFHFNDQAYYMDLYLRQPVPIQLDYQCIIAQNMQDVKEDELDFSGEDIVNKETGSSPSIIHFNGGSKDKWGREPILKHLNL